MDLAEQGQLGSRGGELGFADWKVMTWKCDMKYSITLPTAVPWKVTCVSTEVVDLGTRVGKN